MPLRREGDVGVVHGGGGLGYTTHALAVGLGGRGQRVTELPEGGALEVEAWEGRGVSVWSLEGWGGDWESLDGQREWVGKGGVLTD